MKQPVVKVQNLIKVFSSRKEKVRAVDGVSFDISKGEIVGLLGPNGAGKTTTIQMLLALITPTSGSIEVFGKSLMKHREEVLARMNFSSTYTHLPFRLTIAENLYVIALLYDVKKPRERVNEVMRQLKLDSVKNVKVGDLSSGWTTRVNVAKAFLNKPEFILLDEPTASLDPESAAMVRREILALGKEMDAAILWTSHNMDEVEEVCDRVIFLDHGKIIVQDTPAHLAASVKTASVRFMLESGSEKLKTLVRQHKWVLEKTERFYSVVLKEKEIPTLLQTMSKAEIVFHDILINRPDLEDFFLSLLKKGNSA